MGLTRGAVVGGSGDAERAEATERKLRDLCMHRIVDVLHVVRLAQHHLGVPYNSCLYAIQDYPVCMHFLGQI